MDVLERLKLRLEADSAGEEIPSDAVLLDCMETAKSAILARRHQVTQGEWPDELPKRYLDLQFRIVLEMVNKMGAEGEIAHNENGVSRTYQSAWISDELLREVVPLGRVV